MEKKQISLSVFFPAYNEEENIGLTLKKAVKIVSEITPDHEIIVVDDGSTDKTAKIVHLIAANQGKWTAADLAKELSLSGALVRLILKPLKTSGFVAEETAKGGRQYLSIAELAA